MKYIKKIVAGIQGVKQTILGQHLWARGYFVASSGNVTDEVIAEYIRTQDTEERQKGDNLGISKL